ncbi:DUF4399 domain-containing protein [Zobellella maritima]|uniref:DUF4399 domain-containing protein n=1 Tax=Zobellella maritima TaxID=2059725 RepID=UPI000E308307|nr:DUF4399 domain-containing protein [Zobellella maritima]
MKNWMASVLLLSPLALATPAPEDAKAYIISPADGEEVAQTFIVRFGLSGMGVAPAGVEKAGTGHHHLLINAGELPDMSTPMPASEQLKHFGGGQTETELNLPPGDYSLQLIMGDHLHVPHQPPVLSEPVRVTVK